MSNRIASRRATATLLILAAIAVGCAESTNTQVSSNSSSHRDTTVPATVTAALDRIKNPNATAEEVDEALDVIAKEKTNEPWDLWIAIISDAQLPPATREACYLAFFRRHVHAGLNLSQLAEHAEVRQWCSPKYARDVTFANKLPAEVARSFDQLIVELRPPIERSDSYCWVYLTLKDVRFAEFTAAILGDAQRRKLVIEQVVVVDYTEIVAKMRGRMSGP